MGRLGTTTSQSPWIYFILQFFTPPTIFDILWYSWCLKDLSIYGKKMQLCRNCLHHWNPVHTYDNHPSCTVSQNPQPFPWVCQWKTLSRCQNSRRQCASTGIRVFEAWVGGEDGSPLRVIRQGWIQLKAGKKGFVWGLSLVKRTDKKWSAGTWLWKVNVEI